MGNHQKHTSLVKPDIGHFGRNEVAIMGTPCGNIKKLSYQLIEALKENLNIAYIDADHKSADEPQLEKNDAMAFGADVEFTDKISHLQVKRPPSNNPFQIKKAFTDQDLIIVNGNHFIADKQILVIDPKKDLQKKLDRITDVSMILLKEPEAKIPDFLIDHLGGINDIPVFNFDQSDKIAEKIKNMVTHSTPKLKGLVLAGGKSERMNRDKGLIDYHGLPQREYAARLLDEFCEEVYISCRPDQSNEFNGDYSPLADTFDGLGPYGGILSAFRADPNSAWLVVACDLPFLDRNTLDQLIKQRNPSKTATSFWDSNHKFPEPLITIWEPKAYPELLHFLGLGLSCPRKVLINSDTKLIEAEDINALTNVNSPEELDTALKTLAGSL